MFFGQADTIHCESEREIFVQIKLHEIKVGTLDASGDDFVAFLIIWLLGTVDYWLKSVCFAFQVNDDVNLYLRRQVNILRQFVGWWNNFEDHAGHLHHCKH